MKNSTVLFTTIVSFAVVLVADATCRCDPPQENCADLCFCPCRIPGGGPDDDLIYPSKECLARIKCTYGNSVCSDNVLACQEEKPKELCFCPCRIPGCKPDVLYYPSQECLQRIRCKFGEFECSAEYLNGNVNSP